MQGIEPLDDSSASLSLKDEFLASIERLTFPDLSTVQVDGLIRAANSLFTSARSSMLVTGTLCYTVRVLFKFTTPITYSTCGITVGI